MTRRLFLALLCCCFGRLLPAQTPIGSWRTHHAYNQLYRVEQAESRIYAAGKTGLMYYDSADGKTGTLSRVDGLSESGVAEIAYDSATECLAIAYTNANVDLVQGKVVYNLSDIRRADISGSKSVHRIRFFNGHAYLCCDFGVVVVNVARHEIARTFYLGSNANRAAVYDMVFTPTEMIAATSQGLMHIDINDPYPNIATRWLCDSTLAALDETPVMTAWFDNCVYVAAQTYLPDSLRLYRYEGMRNYRLVDADQIQSVRATPSQLVVCKWGGIDLYTPGQETPVTLHANDYWIAMANHDALAVDGKTVWVAHDYEGLLAIDLNETGAIVNFIPDAPLNQDNVYRLNADRSRVLLAPGGKRTTYENAYLPARICCLQQDRWQHVTGAALDTLNDIVEAVTDPADPSHIVAASWGKGLVDIRDGRVNDVFNETNSDGALQPYRSGSYRSLRTGGVAFDRQGTLWATNSLARNALVSRQSDGTWNAFDTYSMVGNSEVDHVLCDSVRGYVWFYGRANAIYVHDGGSRMAYVDPNNGSKKNTTSVNCVVQDRSGDMWIGTNGGIKVIYDAYKTFSNGGHGEKSPVNCSNIIIDNGVFVEYLMAYENITCIAVDGANRKWVGTANGGLYLISSNGQEELVHFTKQNSPLLSNKIIALAIHPGSGEVFIGTDCGLISYRSTATYATATPDDDIHAFPNPVEPGYDGPVAIKGFTRDALVHITDAAGHVVFSTRALGGQAIWDGRTNSGRRVASGVYYVFASDEEKGNRSVTKILVIR